jgi:hypothetical protein
MLTTLDSRDHSEERINQVRDLECLTLEADGYHTWGPRVDG